MKTLYAALLFMTLACIGLLAATRISDPDTMQYLASGRYMLAHGLETGCVFNYAGDRCQIVYPQWLFHVITYVTYRVGDWNALVALQLAIALALFGVIGVRQWRASVHPFATSAFCLLAAMVARERFMLRADFFALLLAVLLYHALEAYWDEARSASSRRALLPALAGIELVWANTHGSFHFGFVILGCFLAESVLSRKPGIRTAIEAAAAVVLASLINPYGPKSFLQPLQFMLGGEATAPQLEFLSPFAPADLEHLTVTAYKVLLVVSAATLVLSYRALRVRDVLILAGATYLSVKGVRHIALLAVLVAAILPPYAESIRVRAAGWMQRKRWERRRVPVGIGISAVLIASTAGIAYAAATDRLYRFDAISRRTGFGLTDLVYPIAAADFVERNDLPGVMFNDYSVGTYLNWRLFPARKTFIDGHGYTPEALAHYRHVMAGSVPYREVVDRYGVNVFFLSHKSAEARDLIARLYRDEAWALVYFDEMAAIFLKRSPENENLIARYRVDLRTAERDGPAPLANVREPGDAYLGRTDRGLALSALGLNAEAAVELEEAARENPRSFVTLTAYCLSQEQRGESARALEACQRAVGIRPGYAPGRFWLGLLELRRGRIEDGIHELEEALRINPAFPLAHFNIGAASENRGDKRRAREHYLKELEVNPAYHPAQEALRRLG